MGSERASQFPMLKPSAHTLITKPEFDYKSREICSKSRNWKKKTKRVLFCGQTTFGRWLRLELKHAPTGLKRNQPVSDCQLMHKQKKRWEAICNRLHPNAATDAKDDEHYSIAASISPLVITTPSPRKPGITN